MSEIEKMYENVGLIYCNKCRHDSELDCLYMCESKYPPFTTEKQLELFKLLIRHYKTELYCTLLLILKNLIQKPLNNLNLKCTNNI